MRTLEIRITDSEGSHKATMIVALEDTHGDADGVQLMLTTRDKFGQELQQDLYYVDKLGTLNV